MSESRFKYLRPEDIRKLAGYEFAPKAVVEGYYSGRHRSHTRGPSTEFRDYRQYAQGDDLAWIDWRVHARTDRYYVRTFEQETNMDCHIFLDSSASMGFGAAPSKLEYASFFSAALAYLVMRNTDRVSLLMFDDALREFVPPGSTTRHLHGILNRLERNAPGNRTSIATALRKAFPLLRQRGALIVVSDFFADPAATFEALSPYLHRGFKVSLFHVLAPEELELPGRGLLAFIDMETGSRVVAHTDSLRRRYAETMQAHIGGLRELAVRRGVAYTVARTDTPFYHLFDALTR